MTPWRSGRRGRRLTLPSATVCLVAASLLGLGIWYAVHLRGDGAEFALREGAGLTVGGLIEGRFWEPFTHLFMPGSVTWLLCVELPVLWLAGRHLESVVGRRHVVALFLSAGASGGLAQAVVGSLHGTPDLSVAGPGAGVLAVFVALACAMPELDVVPPLSLAVNGAGWLRTKHGALGAVLAAALITVGTEAAGALQEDDEEFEEPVFAAPAAAAAGKLVVPRFTEVERRMSLREYISARIDPILDKISRHGIGSLTEEERRALENVRQKIGRR